MKVAKIRKKTEKYNNRTILSVSYRSVKTKKLHKVDGPAFTTYYDNKRNSKRREEYFRNGIAHRKDGPAKIEYNSAGGIREEGYLVNGKLHRIDGPAFIAYNADGKIAEEMYYLNNARHRSDGPAYKVYYQSGILQMELYYTDGVHYRQPVDGVIMPAYVTYYPNGRKKIIGFTDSDGNNHRVNGPACAYYLNKKKESIFEEEYMIHGEFSRKDGPAAIVYHSNGVVAREDYYENDVISRIGGPATITYERNGVVSTESWVLDGEDHRVGAPAYTRYTLTGKIKYEEYYINGANYPIKEEDALRREAKFARKFDKELEEVFSAPE